MPPPTTTHRHAVARASGALVALLRLAVRLAHGLRAALGLVLILATGAMLAGTWAFAELAEQVREGTTQPFDDAVLRALDRLHAPWLETVMLEITSLGNGSVVVAMALVAGTFLWLTRHRYSAALLGAATVGATLLSLLLKSIFHRPRPPEVTWGTHVVTSSFPSGHATSAIVVYATIAYLVARLQRRRWARVATLALAAVAILLVAASRLFLGVHYPTDVAAGLAVGLAWAAFCMAMLEAVQRFIRREAPREAANEAPPPGDDPVGDGREDDASTPRPLSRAGRR
ncbi:MAG TPA: phosphatase PAP2 family protein [Gemmatimonadaceae bacterium]|nr:phosphatase PAP2 family protein [Gemmatimonadaceae bacterium]